MARTIERMPSIAFRLMGVTMALEDWLHPTIDRRVLTFGIRAGMTVVDYGCGPARYTPRFAKLVGSSGKVYAVDIQPLAMEAVKQKMAKEHLDNIVPVLVLPICSLTKFASRVNNAQSISSTLSIFVGAQTSKNRRFLMVR